MVILFVFKSLTEFKRKVLRRVCTCPNPYPDPDPKFGERIAVDVFIRPNFGTLNRASVNAAYVYSRQLFPLRISDPDQDSDKCERALSCMIVISCAVFKSAIIFRCWNTLCGCGMKILTSLIFVSLFRMKVWPKQATFV